MTTPAEQLVGRTLGSGWIVEQPIQIFQGQTGGRFSTGYYVRKGATRAFLKAMDFHDALLAPDSIGKLQEITTRIQYERGLLEYCGTRGLSRIVRLVEAGHLFFDDSNTDQIKRAASRVDFLVFELADGDLRKRLTLDPNLPGSWKLRVLRSIASAIEQLHSIGVAHQDIKPSNVLGFAQDTFKVGDLGRSSREGHVAPTDGLLFPGDNRYSPPEYQYGFYPADRIDRRLGCDAYMLGSMISFLYVGMSATYLLQRETPAPYLPGTWKGRYEDALPFLIDAQAKGAQALRSALPATCSQQLIDAYILLTHPDPLTRGHPRSRAQPARDIGINRFVSLFDHLAAHAEIEERASKRS